MTITHETRYFQYLLLFFFCSVGIFFLIICNSFAYNNLVWPYFDKRLCDLFSHSLSRVQRVKKWICLSVWNKCKCMRERFIEFKSINSNTLNIILKWISLNEWYFPSFFVVEKQISSKGMSNILRLFELTGRQISNSAARAHFYNFLQNRMKKKEEKT